MSDAKGIPDQGRRQASDGGKNVQSSAHRTPSSLLFTSETSVQTERQSKDEGENEGNKQIRRDTRACDSAGEPANTSSRVCLPSSSATIGVIAPKSAGQGTESRSAFPVPSSAQAPAPSGGLSLAPNPCSRLPPSRNPFQRQPFTVGGSTPPLLPPSLESESTECGSSRAGAFIILEVFARKAQRHSPHSYGRPTGARAISCDSCSCARVQRQYSVVAGACVSSLEPRDLASCFQRTCEEEEFQSGNVFPFKPLVSLSLYRCTTILSRHDGLTVTGAGAEKEEGDREGSRRREQSGRTTRFSLPLSLPLPQPSLDRSCSSTAGNEMGRGILPAKKEAGKNITHAQESCLLFIFCTICP